VVAQRVHQLRHRGVRLHHPAEKVQQKMLVDLVQVPTLHGVVEQSAQRRVAVGASPPREVLDSPLGYSYSLDHFSHLRSHLRLRRRESLAVEYLERGGVSW